MHDQILMFMLTTIFAFNCFSCFITSSNFTWKHTGMNRQWPWKKTRCTFSARSVWHKNSEFIESIIKSNVKMTNPNDNTSWDLITCIVSYLSVSFLAFVTFLLIICECLLIESCNLLGKAFGLLLTLAAFLHMCYTFFYCWKVIHFYSSTKTKKQIWMTNQNRKRTHWATVSNQLSKWMAPLNT